MSRKIKKILISKEELDDAINYFNKSISDIADELNVDKYTILKIARSHGLDVDKDVQKTEIKCKFPVKNVSTTSKKFVNLLKKLEACGITYDARHHDALIQGSASEGLKQFVVKSIIFYILRGKKHDIFTETKVQGEIINVLDVTTETCYKIINAQKLKRSSPEKQGSTKFNEIIIDPEDLPDDINEIKKQLELRV